MVKTCSKINLAAHLFYDGVTNKSFLKAALATGIVKLLGSTGHTFKHINDGAKATKMFWDNSLTEIGSYFTNESMPNLNLQDNGEQLIYGLIAIGGFKLIKDYGWPAIREIPIIVNTALNKSRTSYASTLEDNAEIAKEEAMEANKKFEKENKKLVKATTN